MAGESDADAERKSENFERMMNPSKFSDIKTLDSFSDKELQAELRKRKAQAKTEEERERLKRIHNAPIQKEIDILKRELVRLENKLK